MLRTLIFDFDGTVCLGDGPALAYAQALSAADPAMTDLDHRLARHLAGEALEEFAGTDDGYGAVFTAAHRAGVHPETVQAAFLHARSRLAAEGLGVHAPAGLAEFCAEARDAGVHLLLLTNAPALGMEAIVAYLGLADAFDEVRADAGKPDGFHAVLDEIEERRGPITRRSVASVGDIWRNDLAVPQQRGATTAAIDPYDRRIGTPDAAGHSLSDLYPFLRAWWTD